MEKLIEETVVMNEDGTISVFAPYRAKFTIDEVVPVDLAIRSLKSFEALLHRTKPLMSTFLQDAQINSTEVFVKEVGEGSFIVDFLVKYVIGEENKEKAEEIYDSTLRNNEKLKLVVALGLERL